MMALTQENVHYTLNSDSGVMNKLNMVHARIQEFLSGGGGGGGGGGRGGGGGGVGGVGGRGPTARKQSGQCFFQSSTYFTVCRVDPMVYYREEEGVQLLPGGGGVQRNPYNL